MKRTATNCCLSALFGLAAGPSHAAGPQSGGGGLRHADNMARSNMNRFVENLTVSEVKVLMPDIVQAAISPGPADTMFSSEHFQIDREKISVSVVNCVLTDAFPGGIDRRDKTKFPVPIDSDPPTESGPINHPIEPTCELPPTSALQCFALVPPDASHALAIG